MAFLLSNPSHCPLLTPVFLVIRPQVNRGLPSAVGPKRGPVSATAKSASFPLIYMAVLPGAGSLYVRELLEATTGLVVETAFKEAGSQPEQRDMDLKATFARSCGIVGSCERVHRSKDKEALILASYEPLDAKIDASDFRRSAAYLIVLIRNPVDAYATQVRAGGSAGRDFVHYLTHQWIEFVKYWEASRLPKTTVRYEDLAVNPEGAIGAGPGHPVRAVFPAVPLNALAWVHGFFLSHRTRDCSGFDGRFGPLKGS